MSAIIRKIIAFFMSLLAFFGIGKGPANEPAPDAYTVEGKTVTFCFDANITPGYSWEVQLKGDALQMTRDEENNIYTATITTEGKNIDPNDGIGYNYFSFTKMLSEYENDWNTIAPYRFGAVTEGGDFLVTNEQLNKELSLEMNGDPHAFKIPAGQWNLTLSVDHMTLIIEKVVPAGKRGDVDGNSVVDINDVTILINYLLKGSWP